MKIYQKNITSGDLMIVAEIGVNHEGCLEKAKELIYLAAQAGVHVVKFQSYTPERFIASHDVARFQRVSRFALSQKDHIELSNFTRNLKIGFMSTPVTEDWVTILEPLCEALKIASGDITFKPVIKKAVCTGKPIILSVGAATLEEIDQAVNWVREEIGDQPLADRLVLLHCVAAYPVPIEEANILSIPFLRDRYNVCVGYSNHVIGIEACLAAVALGASVIEVHFTDCKEGREFRDHALSFDSKDLKNFIPMACAIKKSLGVYGKFTNPCESNMIPMIRKGLIAAKNLKEGTILSEQDLMYARPATEFSANEISSLIGKQLKQDVMMGHLIPRSALTCVE